jgi:hypothetical protein
MSLGRKSKSEDEKLGGPMLNRPEMDGHGGASYFDIEQKWIQRKINQTIKTNILYKQ